MSAGMGPVEGAVVSGSPADRAGGMDLVARLAGLGRALRGRAVRVSLSDEVDAVEALTLVDLGDRDEVHRALLTAFKIRPHDRAVFDELFARLWHTPVAGATAGARQSAADNHPRAGTQRRSAPAEGADPGTTAGAGDEIGYSPEAILRRKSFDQCVPAEILAMERLIARLAVRLATRRSRRRLPSRGRGIVDLRRSFRRAVANGGEFLALARRDRPVEEPRLVVLCDTSGSMDPHVRFLLSFVVALRRVARRSEIFAFNTALVRLTPLLRPGSLRPGLIEGTLSRLAAEVPDWSGGTRIGECLREFTERHLASLVDHRTVVLILSDGLDRGDVAPVAAAMRALRARARSVLWLNPLAGDTRYEPTARAMAAALPHVSRLLPAHNLESLERLVPLLSV